MMLDINEQCTSSYDTVGCLTLEAVITSAHRLEANVRR